MHSLATTCNRPSSSRENSLLLLEPANPKNPRGLWKKIQNIFGLGRSLRIYFSFLQSMSVGYFAFRSEKICIPCNFPEHAVFAPLNGVRPSRSTPERRTQKNKFKEGNCT